MEVKMVGEHGRRENGRKSLSPRYSMGTQELFIHELEDADVGRLQDHRRGDPRLDRLGPAKGTEAPAIAGFETGKHPLRPRRGQIVSPARGKGEKLLGHLGTDHVGTGVRLPGVTETVAVKACERIIGAALEGFAEHVRSHRG